MLSGEEFIGKVTEETETTLTVKDPLAMIMVAENKMGMAPWLPLAETTEFVINKSFVVVAYTPKQELESHYNQTTGGIVIAPGGALNQLGKVPPNFGR